MSSPIKKLCPLRREMTSMGIDVTPVAASPAGELNLPLRFGARPVLVEASNNEPAAREDEREVHNQNPRLDAMPALLGNRFRKLGSRLHGFATQRDSPSANSKDAAFIVATMNGGWW